GVAGWRLTDTVGHFAGAVKRQCTVPSNAVFYRAMPGRAGYNSACRARDNRGPNQGGRDGRNIRWYTATRETARGAPGFVEGNRGIPPSRRDHSPALGKARGDARPPAPA